MYALVAQMVEQRTENPSVGGSIPPHRLLVQFRSPAPPTNQRNFIYGKIPERPNGSDCKSDVFDFGGSNPPLPTKQASPIEDACFHVVFWTYVGGVAFLPFDG